MDATANDTHIVIKGTSLPGPDNEPKVLITGRRGVLPSLIDAQADPEGARKALANVKVLDIVGSVPQSRLEAIFKLINHPIILRARLDEHGACTDPEDFDSIEGNFPVMVTFTSLSPPDLAEGEVWAQPLPPVPDGVEKYVLNVAYNPTDKDLRYSDFSESLYNPSTLKEVVTIFSPIPGIARRGSLGETRPQGDVHSVALGVLNELLTVFALSLLKTQHTFVDMLSIRPDLLGFEDVEMTTEELRAALIESFESRIMKVHAEKAKHRSEDEIKAALERIKFVTLDEYKQTVSAEEFRLETVE